MTGSGPERLVEVVGGSPTDEELAALAAVVIALRRGRPDPHAPATSTLAGGWRSYWHTVRTPLVPDGRPGGVAFGCSFTRPAELSEPG